MQNCDLPGKNLRTRPKSKRSKIGWSGKREEREGYWFVTPLPIAESAPWLCSFFFDFPVSMQKTPSCSRPPCCLAPKPILRRYGPDERSPSTDERTNVASSNELRRMADEVAFDELSRTTDEASSDELRWTSWRWTIWFKVVESVKIN